MSNTVHRSGPHVILASLHRNWGGSQDKHRQYKSKTCHPISAKTNGVRFKGSVSASTRSKWRNRKMINRIESNRCEMCWTNKWSSGTKSARRLWLKKLSMIGKWSTRPRWSSKSNVGKRPRFNKKWSSKRKCVTSCSKNRSRSKLMIWWSTRERRGNGCNC